jgi:hypothetical protein
MRCSGVPVITLLRRSFPVRLVATHHLPSISNTFEKGRPLPVRATRSPGRIRRAYWRDSRTGGSLSRDTVTKEGERSPSPWQSSQRTSSWARMSGAA